MNNINTSQLYPNVLNKRTFVKRMLTRISVILGLLCFFVPANATHIVGGSLTYKCQGGDQYEVTLRVFRDCFYGAPDAFFDDPASVGIFDGATNMLISEIKLDFSEVNDTLDNVLSDPCLFVPDDVCVHTTTYTTTVDLPFRNGGYILSYQRCCRNQTIVNIVEPLETGATYVATVSEQALLECNNGANFNNYPPIFICVNEPIFFDHSATDEDGDSLVYKLCTPNTGATSQFPKPQPPSAPPYDPVTYAAPYNLSNLMGGDDVLSIDSETGLLTGLPPIIGQFVVGVCVEEYRDGELISTTRRDFQYNVGNCGEIQSVITNPGILCDQFTVAFENESTLAENYIWDFGDPTNPGAGSTEAEPTYTYPDTGTYTVTLISEPASACVDTLLWDIQIKYSTVEADFNFFAFKCEDDVLITTTNASFDPENELVSFDWTVSDGQSSTDENPVFLVDASEDITIMLTALASDGCEQTFEQLIPVKDAPDSFPIDTLYTCLGDDINLFPNALGIPSLTYSWSPSAGLSNPNTINPTANPSETTMYTLSVSSAQNPGCAIEYEKLLIVGDAEQATLTATVFDPTTNTTTQVTNQSVITACNGEDITLTIENTTTSSSNVQWTDQNGNIIGTGMTIQHNGGDITYTAQITDDAGCAGSASITIEGNPPNVTIQEVTNAGSGSGITDIDGDGIFDLCPNEVGGFTVNNLNPADNNTYLWTGDTQIISDGINATNPVFSSNTAGIYSLVLVTTNQYGCTSNTPVQVEIHALPGVNILTSVTDDDTGSTTTIIGQEVVTVCEGETATLTTSTTTSTGSGFDITWTDQDGNVVGTDDSIVLNPDGMITYTVTVANAIGCENTSSIVLQGSPVEIQINEIIDNNVNDDGFDDVDGDGIFDFCEGDEANLTVLNLDPNDNNTYEWSGDTQVLAGDLNTANNSVNTNLPAGIYSVVLTTTNQYGCEREDVVQIEVHAYPIIDISAEVTNVITGEVTTSTDQDLITLCDQTALLTLTSTNTTINSDAAITWEDQDGNEVGFGPSIFVDPDGIVTYSAVISNAVGCATKSKIILQGSPVNIVVQEIDGDSATGSGLSDLNGDGVLDLCPDDVSSLTVVNLDPNDINTYLWEGDIQIITSSLEIPNPTLNNEIAGIYNLTLITTNQYGCSSETQVPIEVHAFPSIDIDAVITNNETGTSTTVTGEDSYTDCEGGTITLTTSTTTTTGSDITVQWFDNNNNPIGDGTSVGINPDGSQTYNAVITNAIGCSTVSSITVQSEPADIQIDETITDSDGDGYPDLDLTVDGILDFCAGEPNTLNATNLDNNDNITYEWTGDMQVIESGENTANPVISSMTPGVYTLNLIGTNQYGCSDEAVVQVEIYEIPTIDIDATITDVETSSQVTVSGEDTVTDCSGETITLTTSTTTSTSYDATVEWFDSVGNPVGNGDNVTVNPDGSETYIAVITNAVGCSSFTEITVQGSPVDIEVDETVTDTNGDGFPNLDVNLDGALDLCAGDAFQLNITNFDPNDNNTYEWTSEEDIFVGNTGSTAEPIINAGPGDYTLNLLVTNQYGCTQSETVLVTALDIGDPVNFTTEQDCIGLGVQFESDNPNYEYYTWTFGDPDNPDVSLTGVQNPTYTYNTPGNYDVTLTPLEGLVCSAEEAAQSVLVAESVVDLNFSYNYVSCTEDEIVIQFTDGSSTSQGAINNWNWVFSNGMTSSDQNPTITITEDMMLNAALTVVNNTACDGTTEQQLPINIINDVQIADALISCINDGAINLNDDGNPNYNYSWFPTSGLDNPDTANPVANPDETTVYEVTITDDSGADVCQITQSIEVVVPEGIGLEVEADGTETGDFEIDIEAGQNTVTTCEDETVTFTSTSTTGSITDYTIEWIDADGNVVESDNIQVDPSGSQTFTVEATDENGCMETAEVVLQGGPVDIEIEQTVVTNPDGNGNSGILNTDGTVDLCLGQAFDVEVTNLDANDELTYSWTGDNIIVDGADSNSPTIDASQSGQYTIFLETTNQFGCTQTDEVPVTVVDPSDALSFDQTPDCNGVSVVFENTSSQDIDYIFTVGDADNPLFTTSDDQFEYTFPEIGEYDVTLVADANVACLDAAAAQVAILNPVLLEVPADFETDCVDAATLNATINLEDWDIVWFDENNDPIPGGATVDVTPDGEVVYTVVATDINGCSTEQQLTVTGTGLNVDVEDALFFCQDEEGQFTVINSDAADELTYVWTGDGITGGSDAATVTVNTEAFAEGTLNVVVTNQYGCSTAEDAEYVVFETEDQPSYVANGQCEGLEVTFQNNSPNAGYYTWDFGDGNSSNEPNPVHTYAEAGDYEVTLSLPDGANCFPPFALDVLVEEDPMIDMSFEDFFDSCDEEAVINITDGTVSGNQGEIVDWDWDFGEYGTSDEQNPTIVVDQTTTVPVTLTVETEVGCIETLEGEIPVQLISSQPAIPDEEVCIEDLVELNSDFIDSYDYEWSGPDISDPSVPNPTVTGLETGITTYMVTITDDSQNGCTSEQTVNVEVPDIIELNVDEDQNVCNENPILVNAGTAAPGTTITWANEAGDSIGQGEEIMLNPGVFPIQTVSYTVSAVDALGCTETETINISNYQIEVDLQGDETQCIEDVDELVANGFTTEGTNINYQWTVVEGDEGSIINGENSSIAEVDPLMTTTYEASVSNGVCDTTATFTVEVIDLTILADPEVSQDTVYAGGEVDIMADDSQDFIYDWDGNGLNEDDIFDPTATPDEPGENEYTVTIFDEENGCVVEQNVLVFVLERICDEPFIFFPTAFSPNGDGENDALRLRANEDSVQEVYWAVYNRWGEKVYETTNLNDQWNGEFKGEMVMPDVYGFCVRVVCTDGQEYNTQGNVSILR